MVRAERVASRATINIRPPGQDRRGVKPGTVGPTKGTRQRENLRIVQGPQAGLHSDAFSV